MKKKKSTLIKSLCILCSKEIRDNFTLVLSSIEMKIIFGKILSNKDRYLVCSYCWSSKK